MSHAVRSLLNKRAAEHLENLVDADLPSQSMAWRIADHWQSAGNQARSLHWRRVCWQQLLSIGQPLAAAESIRSYLACSPSLTARVRMLDQLAEALRHASDAKGQLQVLEERKALSDKVGDADAVRLALAADTAEACFHSFDDTTKLLPDLRSLLRAVLLDEERRLRIARVLIVTADSMLSEPLAREAVEAVPETPRTARSASTGLEVKLIYHATFGDRKTAVELADLLHAAAEKQELSPAKVMSHLTASLGLRIVDTRPLELSLLARLYEQCVDASMFGVAIRIASRLGSMLHEDGEIETATEWCARTSALIDKSGIQRLATEYVTLRIDLALGNQDFDLASRLIELAPTQFPMYSSPKWSNAYHVYLTRVQQRQGQLRLSPERLTRLLDWHFAAQQLGRHDDHMEVLWTALRAEGRSDYASELLSSYLLRFRRELRPCIFSLRSRTADDPAWSETLLCSASPAKRPARRHRQLSSLGNA